MSWRCGWRCWREPTRPRCGGGWTPRRRGSRWPRGRPPWHGYPHRPGMATASRLTAGTPGRRAGCCWWSTSSRSCSPSATRRGSGGRSSPRCTRPPPPGMARISHRRPWSCWGSRAGQALTLADYERTGGIEGAVAGSAQGAYDRLTPGQQAAARQVFTRLVATSAEGVDSADRATRAELTEGKSPAEAQDVEQVLEAFAAERLLTLAAGTVELSHEALLTAWPLLRDTWLADTHADRIVRSRLHTTAAEWARQARDPSYLYGGSLLQAAADTAARIGADPARHPPLCQTERDFLRASSRAHRRTIRRRQAVIASLLALTLTALAAAAIAVHNAATTSHQHAIALSR